MYFLILVSLVLIIVYLTNQTRRPRNYPPGPAWVPFVGNLPKLKKLSKLLNGQHLALAHLASEYKTSVLGLKLGKDYVVTVFSQPLVRKVLTSEEFEGRPDNFFLRLRCMGKKRGITSTDGEVWLTQRHFVVRHLKELGFGSKTMELMIQEEIAEVLTILENQPHMGVQIGKILAPAVINVLWSLTTGSRISRANPLLDKLLDLLTLRSKAFDMSGGTLSLHPWLRFVAPEWSGFNLIKQLNGELHAMFMEVIQEHFNSWKEGSSDDLIYSYISEMKRASNGNSANFTSDQLIMVCADIFIAGSQTTSNTLDFIFLMMILHPEIQEKVCSCIDKQFPKEHNLGYADRFKVPYVEAVILEVERYYNVAPVIGPRRVLRDTTLGGYSIPKNTTVLISVHSVHFDKDSWTDPHVFRPERFLDGDGNLSLASSEHLIPFGLGKRRCLGEILARTCIFIFFVEIMRKFRISLEPNTETPTGVPLPGITLSPEYYKAVFTSRR